MKSSMRTATARAACVALLIGLAGVRAGYCENGPDLAFFERPGAQIPTLPPLDPHSTQATVDARHFDLHFAQQVAEREMLWVRDRIAHHASEREVRSALDLIAGRQGQYGLLSDQAQDDQALDAAVRAHPRDVDALRRRAEYWADAMQGEREAIFDASDPRGRVVLGDQVHLDVQTGSWVYPVMLVRRAQYGEGPTLRQKSPGFPLASTAVAALLSAAPNDAEALYRFFQVYRYSTQSIQDIANRGAQLSGPYAAALRAYVLTTDPRVGQMRARATQLRIGRTVIRNVISTGIGTPVPKGLLMAVPTHIAATAAEISEANSLDAQANALAAAQQQLLNATVATAPMSEPMFVMLAAFTTDLPNDVVRDRLLRYALALDPGDWRIYEIFAEISSGHHPDMETEERAADTAQKALLWHPLADPSQLVIAQSKIDFDFFTYQLARRALRLRPAGCGQNVNLAVSLEEVHAHRYDGAPVIPDGTRQSLFQWLLTAQVCQRELEHPGEWHDWTRQRYVQELADARGRISALEAQTGFRP